VHFTRMTRNPPASMARLVEQHGEIGQSSGHQDWSNHGRRDKTIHTLLSLRTFHEGDHVHRRFQKLAA